MDLLLAACCLLVTFAYIGSMPWTLNNNDEGLFYYEAKRILNGDAMYLDFFHFVAPGAWYLMTGAYAVFGVQIATAKLTMAFVHGLTSALLFIASRQLGASRSMALSAPMVFWLICWIAWPIGSPHWISTMLTCSVLVVVLLPAWDKRYALVFLAGLLTGGVAVVQQHKGVVLAPVVVALLVVESRREDSSWRQMAARFATWMAGWSLVVFVTMGFAICRAGFDPVFEALVIHPLFHYAPNNSTSWGAVHPLAEELALRTYPRILRFSPVLLLAAIAIAFWSHRRSTGAGEAQRWLAASGITAAAFAGTFNYPDFVHIAFSLPPALAVGAGATTWCGQRLARGTAEGRSERLGRVFQIASTATVLVLAVASVRQWKDYRSDFEGRIETRFGTVAARGPVDTTGLTLIEEAMQRAGSREIYVYNWPEVYLYIDADNPTPYDITSHANPLAHDRHVIQILEEREVPIVIIGSGFLKPRTELHDYIRRHYVPYRNARSGTSQGLMVRMGSKADPAVRPATVRSDEEGGPFSRGRRRPIAHAGRACEISGRATRCSDS